jgi:hypothetical protein
LLQQKIKKLNMKNLLLSFLFISFASHTFAQDTITVQTLDFSDITKRRGWYVFPSDTTNYQKILMYYTLKCDAATTQDNYACGEWDYTTYTNLYDYQNIGQPYYSLNGSYPDTINYSNSPIYTYYQQYLKYIVYDNTVTETPYTVNNGTFETKNASQANIKNNKAQYLINAAELTGAGLTAGSIDKLAIDLTSLGSTLNHLKVKLKHTSATNFSSPEVTGFTEVFHFNTTLASGTNTLNFTTPFIWDGSSNIIIELNYSNQVAGTDNKLSCDSSASFSSLNTIKRDGYLDLDRSNDYVTIPDDNLLHLTNSMTIEAWVKPTFFPNNAYESTIIGKDADQNNGSGYALRFGSTGVLEFLLGTTAGWKTIASPANGLTLNEWQHVAATYDGATMKLYINGSLVGQVANASAATTNTMDLNIGAGYNGGNRKMKGGIDEVRIWNTVLSQTDIDNWKNFNLNASHPNYANLIAQYQFDDETNPAKDNHTNSFDGNVYGFPSWKEFNGDEMIKDFVQNYERLNFTLTQGIYTTHLDSTLVTDTVQNPQITIIENNTTRDLNVSGVTVTAIDTTYGWQSGWSYTYDEFGNVVDSVFINYDTQLINTYAQTTFQLQNYVTPYGIGLSLGNNGFRWVYDVTDYMPLLHDTVEISAGNQQELIDLKFIMIKGTPPRDVRNIESIWLGDYQHADIANDVVMPAVNIDLDPAAVSFRVKTRTSGHWFGGFQNCAEFCPKDHNVFVDGVKRFEWSNWKLCAGNPVIAQGGTWVYDRAGWCPGSFTDTYDHELTPYVTPGTSVSLDYGMQTTAGGMEGNYRTTMQLVTYGANNFNLDARIDEIISPNDWEYRSKINPICADAKIVIQNTGTTPLTSLTITYNVLGGAQETYNWTGNLAFLDKEEVTLPIPSQTFWATGSTQNIFQVAVSAPNGGVDEYADNNNASSTFEKPDVYSGKFYLRVQTNSAANENSYTIKDDQGNVVMSRFTMANNTIYYDTINLADGCYVLDFLDSDDDGLSFFANSDGNGSLRIWSDPLVWSKTFNAKFGSFIKHYFVIDNTVGIDSYDKIQEIEVFPNPSNGIFNLNVTGFENETINIGIYNTLGDVLYSQSKKSINGNLKTSFDLSDIPNGIYFVRIIAKNGYAVKRVIKN